MKELTSEQLEVVLNQWDDNHSYNTFRDGLKEKGLIKEEFEVGKWYKTSYFSEKLICLTSLRYDEFIEGGISHNHYGFENGDWKVDSWSNTDMSNSLIPATDKEVEAALIKEAKKRGFKEGVKAVCLDSKMLEKLGEHHCNSNCEFDLISSDFYCYDTVIFKKGKWATIIEEPKVDKMNEVLDEAISKLTALKNK